MRGWIAYSTSLIVDEARRRGVQCRDRARAVFFRLPGLGRTVHAGESLSELTSGPSPMVDLTTENKPSPARVMEKGQPSEVPGTDGGGSATAKALEAFLKKHGKVVVKPARGEQGRGGGRRPGKRRKPWKGHRSRARDLRPRPGRILLRGRRSAPRGHRPSAGGGGPCAVPPHVVCDGRATIRELIETQSRRRSAATGGESHIPIDGETERCLAGAGFGLDDVLESGHD